MSALEKLLKIKSLSKIETSLGKLHLYPLTAGASIELSKINREDINKINPEKYVRNFIRMVCFPENTLVDGKVKPDYYPLSESDVMSLTYDEVEVIAKEIIINNEYLYKETIKVKNDKDDSDSSDDIIHPMNEGESYIEYLYRLQVIQDKEIKEMQESILGPSYFSKSLTDSIGRTFAYGNTLGKTWNDISRMTSGISEQMRVFDSLPDIVKNPTKDMIPELSIDSSTSRFDELNEHFAESARIKEENRRKPFDDLGERLDLLINETSKSHEHMKLMNHNQIRAINETKKSSLESSEQARESIKISKKGLELSERSIELNNIVIKITVLGVLVSAVGVFYPVYQSSSKEKSEMALVSEGLEAVSLGFSNLSNKIESNNEHTNQLLLAKIEQINEKSSLQQKYYEELLKKQKDESAELKKIIKSQGDKLAFLERKLEEASSPKPATN